MSCCAERFVATCTIRSPTAWIASSPRMHTRSWRTLKEIVRGSSLSLKRAMCTLNTLLSSSSKDNSSIWLVVPNNSCSSPMIWAEAQLTSTISCSWHGWSNHQPVINIFLHFWPQSFTKCRGCGPNLQERRAASEARRCRGWVGFRMECRLDLAWMNTDGQNRYNAMPMAQNYLPEENG